MSQSPLSRAIRELERELGLVLFVRTTRRVELTPAGSSVLLERARRALAEIEAAVDDARRTAEPDAGVLGVGYTPFTRLQAMRISETGEEAPGATAPARGGRDSGTVAADRHPQANGGGDDGDSRGRRVAMAFASTRSETSRCWPRFRRRTTSRTRRRLPIGVFAAERVSLPREPPDGDFRRVAPAQSSGLPGSSLSARLERRLSAPWDRRMLPVADGEAVSVVVGEWVEEAIEGVVAVPLILR